MAFVAIELLNGLSSAASLFLLAAGLSIIFGVTRIVNFAHGSLYMLGAYIAYSFVTRLPATGLGYWGGILAAALAVGALGAAIEMLLLRRLYRAPELHQLLATFGVVLIVADATLALWGPEDLLASRPPGLAGAVRVFGQPTPSYDLFLAVAGPLVLALLWLLFRHTRWGVLVRAATEDRDMVAALGHDQRRLFTAVFFLGAALAGLGGALQLPRAAATLQMDLSSIVDAFVVVVVGGMGSILGAYLAAVLVSMLQVFGIVFFPKFVLLLVFAAMAVVLAVRPHGLFGRPQAEPRSLEAAPVRQLTLRRPWAWALAAAAALILLPLLLGSYGLAVLTEIVVLALFAAALNFMMGPGGMISFGQAAFFGIGAYGAALVLRVGGVPMLGALVVAPLAAAAFGAFCGFFCARLSGVYLAMFTLAVAEVVWSAATEWTALTGGDNGILGVWPAAWAARPYVFYLLALALAAGSILLLRRMTAAPLGFALRATRDAPLRAAATGIDGLRVRWAAFVIAAAGAGLAGGLYAFAKGGVFPSYVAIERSVTVLVMVLLGGLHWASGPLIGAVAYVGLQDELLRFTDLWRLVLGLVIIGLVVAFPDGLAGALTREPRR